MVPTLAFLIVGRAIGVRWDALLSFDAAAARRAFPDEAIEPIKDKAWQRWARKVAVEALCRYPAKSLLARVNKVYVVWTLRYEGTDLGATNDPDASRIVISLGWDGMTAAWLSASVHHELAHVLEDRKETRFPKTAWLAFNDPSFHYADDGLSAIRVGRTNESFDPKLNVQGVLSEYGASSLDEDWATIAESIMVDAPAFWGLLEKYPRLRAKARLAVAFYRRTFPGIRLRDVGQ